MSLIVAGRFDTFHSAQLCARTLFQEGVAEEDATVFFVGPSGMHSRTPIGGDVDASAGTQGAHRSATYGAGVMAAVGAVVGGVICVVAQVSIYVVVLAAAVGAFIGTLAGAMGGTRRTHNPDRAGVQQASRHSGVLLAVHVTVDNEARVARLIRANGGMDVEKALGRWQDGQWSDFDPLAAPVLHDKVVPSRPTVQH